MKFKAQPKPPQEPLERDDVHVAANRCPFCHSEVAATESSVCQSCLARHHEGCWTEHGSCSSCGAEVRLVRDGQGPGPESLEARKGRLNLIALGFLVIGAILFPFGGIGIPFCFLATAVALKARKLK